MNPMKISPCYQESYNQLRGSQVWLSKIVPYPKIRPSASVSGSHPGIKPEKGQDKKIRGRQAPCKTSCCALLLLTGSYMTMLILRAGLTTVFITTDSRPSIFCNAKLKFRVENFFVFKNKHTANQIRQLLPNCKQIHLSLFQGQLREAKKTQTTPG